jgi:hypothetical protein
MAIIVTNPVGLMAIGIYGLIDAIGLLDGFKE